MTDSERLKLQEIVHDTTLYRIRLMEEIIELKTKSHTPGSCWAAKVIGRGYTFAALLGVAVLLGACLGVPLAKLWLLGR